MAPTSISKMAAQIPSLLFPNCLLLFFARSPKKTKNPKSRITLSNVVVYFEAHQENSPNTF